MATVTQYDRNDIVRSLAENPPGRIKVPVPDYAAMPNYKKECMCGEAHPMGIEAYDFHLVIVERITCDSSQRSFNANNYPWNKKDEEELITSMARLPHVEWAIENSFDGLYIIEQPCNSGLEYEYLFGVYLYSELATFWNLKYGVK